jgi:uncharacterized protein involved in exopolysaccharide biosynthesis
MRFGTFPAQYQAHADVTLMPSPWDEESFKGVGVLPLAASPQAVIERTSQRAWAEAVAMALVQQGIAEGGPWGRLATRDEVQAAAAGLEGRLRLEALGESDKIRIEVVGCPTPQEAEATAEFAARVFIEQNRRWNLDKYQQAHTLVTNTLADVQRQLSAAETAEAEFKQKMGFQGMGNLDEEMARRHQELKEVQATREGIQANLEQMDSKLKENTAQLPAALSQVTDNVVDRLFQELDALLQKQPSMNTAHPPAFPGLEGLADEIAEKQKTILDALRKLDAGEAGGSTVWRQRQELYRQRIELRLRLTELEIRAAALEGMSRDSTPQLPELASQNLEYGRLAQETKRLRDRFDTLRQQEWELRSAISQGGGQLERFDPVSKAAVMPRTWGDRLPWQDYPGQDPV